MKKLYPKIRQLREEANLSGYDAAVKAGLSFPTYYGLETRPSDPNADTFLAVLGMLASIAKEKPQKIFDQLLEERPNLERVEPVINRGVLTKLRTDAGLSVLALSKETGISPTTLYNIELLPVNAMADTFLAVVAVLSKHLKKSPYKLLEEIL